MDALEMQALMIRHKAAMKVVGTVDPHDLLAMVIAPPPRLRETSLAQAAKEGISLEAIRLAMGRTRGRRLGQGRPRVPPSRSLLK